MACAAMRKGAKPGIGDRSGATRLQHAWRRARDTVQGYLFLAPFFVFYLIFLIYPVLQGFYISLHRRDLIGTVQSQWIGLGNYSLLLHDKVFWSSLSHTVYFVILSSPVMVSLGLLLALVVNRRYATIGAIRTLLYLPCVFSVSVVTTVWLKVYDPQYGLLANIWRAFGLKPIVWLTSTSLAMPAIAITSVWWGVGGNMVICLAGLQDIPAELYEAAMLDGANRWKLLLHITIPGLRRALAFVTIMEVISAFQIFGQVYNMTDGGPVGLTRTLVMYIYEVSFRDWTLGYGSALAYALFAIMFALSLLQLRFYMRTER